MTAVIALPVNVFLLMKFSGWTDVLFSGEGLIFVIVVLGYALILLGVEEVVHRLNARLIWRKQYKLVIRFSRHT